MAKSLLDYLSDDDLARYNELMQKAADAKKNAPKAPRVVKPKTPEQKKAAIEARLAKAQAALDALLAAENNSAE